METKIITILNSDTKMDTAENDSFTEEEEKQLKYAGEVIKQGGLVAFPTDTVYGLGGDALNPKSSEKIYAAKGRPSDNPLIVHISRLEDLRVVAKEVSKEAEKIAQAFWPGPLTMILPKADCVPFETTGGLNTVAVRFPSHPVAKKLITYGGGFIAAPSANLSGKPSPTLAQYVVEDMQGRIDVIIDGGEVGIGLESTIIDLTVTPPQILRPGYITPGMLEQVLGKVEEDITMMHGDTKARPKAPGMKYRHYAPKGDLTIIKGSNEKVPAYINEAVRKDMEQGEKVGIIGTSENLDKYSADVVKCIGSRQDEEAIARNLYRLLREFDDEGVTKIYSECFKDDGLGMAVMNRLLKAAGHKVVEI